MSDRIHLFVSTSGGTVIDEKVNYVLLPLQGGDYGILSDHAPLIGSLSNRPLRYKQGKEEHSLSIEGGVVSVADNEVTVLALAVAGVR